LRSGHLQLRQTGQTLEVRHLLADTVRAG
jgi:hypothetical protein